MKRVFSRTTLVILFLISTSANASSSFDQIIGDSNELRATSRAVNAHAAQLENKIRLLICKGYPVPYLLKQHALNARYKAKELAQASNVVAREAFFLGYVRHAH